MEKCGNLTEENSSYCIDCKPVEKPRKKDAHVQLMKRFNKAIEIVGFVKFTSLDTAYVPSKKEMVDKAHYVHFGKNQFCECSSFTFGFSADPNFTCYHIIAARLRFLETISDETKKSLEWI